MQRANWLEKTPDAGHNWRQEKWITEDEMVGWHHRLSGYDFEQALGDSERQRSLHAAVQGSQRFRPNWMMSNNNKAETVKESSIQAFIPSDNQFQLTLIWSCDSLLNNRMEYRWFSVVSRLDHKKPCSIFLNFLLGLLLLFWYYLPGPRYYALTNST